MGAITVERGGAIVLGGIASRSHPHGCCSWPGMLIRLGADGGLDRSFGRGGAVLVRGGGLTRVESLASRGGHILAAATSGSAGGHADLIFSLNRDGRPDRSFGDDGVARVQLPRHSRRGEGEESVAVLSTPRRILLVRSSLGAPLFAFSPRGRRERGFARGVTGLVPRRQALGPVATLDRGNLVLAWTGYPANPSGRGEQGEANLQRLLLR